MSNPIKGERYLALLDDARCEGRWDAVPELVRKVRKHAPGRQCLAMTAETECAITKAQEKHTASRPATALPPEETAIAEQLSKLQSAIAGESSHLEDKFQGQVCIGWAYWALGDYSTAAAQFLEGPDQGYSQFESSGDTSEWTKVCALKATYLKANCLSRDGERPPALAVFESTLPSLCKIWDGQKGRKELQFWAELFLTEYCMLHTQSLEQGERTLEDPNSLAPFRTWATYWDASRTQGASLVGGQGFRGAVPRRRVWWEYYCALTSILRQDLPFPTGYVQKVPNDASARNQLRMELKKVESAYEALLLSETPFPRADEEREEVELFVHTIMVNWDILSGRNWQEHDLGHGGKEGLSRGILDILYRAATKTFHSTAILRHLFTVHLAVAEFDLAFKAFDSYLEIVKKGKARIDKTGHLEPSLDNDATVLETISKAITALCKYGFLEEAEKARRLGDELEKMLERLPGPLPKVDEQIPTLNEETEDGETLHPRIPAHVNALAWQAIGLAQAQWSRKTYNAVSRSEAQEKAIWSFQKSLSPEIGNPTDVRTLFALGLLLAEQRNLGAAIDFVKAALMSNKKSGDQGSPSDAYWRERSLIPLWHLLALLLSARQDYVMAARACEGAFEQFDDPTVLFGNPNPEGAFRSEHLNEVEAQNEAQNEDSKDSKEHGLVDDMDDLEKEGIIEIKMTQLALLELLEGPDVAVNASHELLLLYTRLFGRMAAIPPSATRRASVSDPKSPEDTSRTRRASIFSTNKSVKTVRRASVTDHGNAGVPSRPHTAGSIVNAAPTIHVTKENGDAADRKSHKSSGSVHSRHRSASGKRRNSLKKRDSTGSIQQQAAISGGGVPHTPTVLDGDVFFTPLGETPAASERPDFFAWSSKNHISSSQSLSAGRGLQRYDSNVSSAKGSTAGDDTVILDSLSAPSTLPAVHFPKVQVDRQRLSVLVKVWLMIAGFYRRADIYQDARAAVEEARKLVDGLTADIAKDNTSAISLTHPGWGGKKSVEELWSDVRSEMAYLFVSEGAPYKARAQFEEALMHYPNHPSAIVGLSNILLDIYSEKLLPTPTIPAINLPDGEPATLGCVGQDASKRLPHGPGTGDGAPRLPSTPLGLGGNTEVLSQNTNKGPVTNRVDAYPSMIEEELPAPYKAVSLPLVDRLAARDRAYGLLTTLTKLGTGWNYSDAWFTLARAHEESGQADKAKEALWWCVELEEGMAVREWTCVGIGGYVL